MTPTLRRYILRNLAPANVGLEFVNRLENPCSLSGTPMSPDLRQWVIQTFGLEMVRVIEAYSSQTPPVFSPEMLDTINRVIPSNYQGDDVNLMFKQQFDTSCGYFWTAQFLSDGLGYSTVIVDNSSGITMSGSSQFDFGLQFQGLATYPCGGYITQNGEGSLWAYSPIEPPGSWYSFDTGSFNIYPFTWTKTTIFDNVTRGCYTTSYVNGFVGDTCDNIISSLGTATGFGADMTFDYTNIINLLQGIFGSQAVVDIYQIDPTTTGLDILYCNIAIVPQSMNVTSQVCLFTSIPCN